MIKHASASQIPFEALELHPEIENPRSDLGDIEGLAESIKSIGLQRPLLVWETTEEDEKKYYLIGGFRRRSAIEKLRESNGKAFAKLPVVRFKGTLHDARVKVLADNLQHKDLTPAEQANYIKKLVNLGYSQKEIAEEAGVTQSWVSALVAFEAGAVPAVKESAKEGSVPMDAALEIGKAPEDDQHDLLEKAQFAKEEGESAKKAVRKARGKTDRPSTKEIREALKYVPDDGGSDEINAASNGLEGALKWVLGEKGFKSMEDAWEYAGVPIPEVAPEPPKQRGRPKKQEAVASDEPKKRGRPKLSDEEKARRKAEREAQKVDEKAAAESQEPQPAPTPEPEPEPEPAVEPVATTPPEPENVEPAVEPVAPAEPEESMEPSGDEPEGGESAEDDVLPF